jgi:NAD(P)-dependent dehydrogenase (short-subunit alcohol dehydrogenase family)
VVGTRTPASASEAPILALGQRVTGMLIRAVGLASCERRISTFVLLELVPLGVRINAIAVGPTESGALVGMMGLSVEQAEAVKQQERENIPLGRRGTPEEAAHWIIAIANPTVEWLTGQVLSVDGGLGLT